MQSRFYENKKFLGCLIYREMCQLGKKQKMVKIYFLKLLLIDLVNIQNLFMIQQSCSWPTFYKMDFMKR